MVPVTDMNGEAVPLDADGALTGTVFSVVTDPHVGKVCMARIHRGTLGHSDSVAVEDGKGEKLGGLFQLVGKRRVN